MKFASFVVKRRVLILLLALLLMIPSVLGMAATRVNYDMLTYLPSDMDTVIGQNILLEEFGKGAFTFLIFEDMPLKDVSALKEKVEQVDHVEMVLWYDTLADISIPMELLPDKVYNEFNTDDATMMAVFFDSGTSDDATMQSVKQIRLLCGEKCFVSGMTALIVDLKNLCEQEEGTYVTIAVVLACAAMLLLLDNWLTPLVFLATIGMMILLNMGSNFFLGEISYITKALSAVLQLAVTMDYSIFLWNSYGEQRKKTEDREEAMRQAIRLTLTSVIGSSVTTVAGFIALCFMSFTLGRDLGIVMAKGVLLGVIGCVTVLPSMILLLDKPLTKAQRRPLIPQKGKLSKWIVKVFPVFLVLFALLIYPAYLCYSKANDEVYYDMGQCLPREMNYVTANEKLHEFNIASTHMILTSENADAKTVKQMTREMEQVDGVKYVLGLESLVGSRIPQDFLPESVRGLTQSGNRKLLLINSVYQPASDKVNAQIDELTAILKKYDDGGMIIGEAPCLKDMIDTTGYDFTVVTAVSIAIIFVIILLVEKSLFLPVILIAVIEFGIFINLGIPHLTGQSMAFITPICISTIELGATIDYAILMTTRYKSERMAGQNAKAAVGTAVRTSIPSILVSGSGMFAATFGVAMYSDIEIVSSMCLLLARGAVTSMLLVIFVLPAMFIFLDKIICRTTLGMPKTNWRKAK